MIFSCATDRPKQFVQTISSILWSQESQQVTLTASDNGFIFTTHENQSLLGIVTIPATSFSSFAFIPDEPHHFTLNLTKFVNCARIFCDSARELEFKALTDLEVVLGINDTVSTTTCTVRCVISEPVQSDMEMFDPIFHISIHSDALRELFRFPNDQRNSSYSVNIDANQVMKQFRVSADGIYGDVVVEMPQTLAEWKILETAESVHASFSSQTIVPFLRALSLSDEAELKISSFGILKVSITVHGSPVVFVMSPLADDE